MKFGTDTDGARKLHVTRIQHLSAFKCYVNIVAVHLVESWL